MRRMVSGVVALAVLTSLVGFVPAAPPGVAAAGPISIWEAWSKGFIEIEQMDIYYNGQWYNDIAYQVRNSGSVDVRISEYVLLLSPNPRETTFGETTQDGFLTKTTVPAGSHVDFWHGDYVVDGILPGPAWWCSEQLQWTQSGVRIFLGGELLPFGMEPILNTLTTGPGGTQDQLWEYLRWHPSPVVGKTVDGEFWQEIPETAGELLKVEIRATNLAIKDTTDAITDPDAPNAVVWDVVPNGYVLDNASISPTGYNRTILPDGSTRISWPANLPAANVTGRGTSDDPTPYISRKFSYEMTTPDLTPGRTVLPRAMVSAGSDFDPEANSELPVMDVLAVKKPPVPDAGGPYEGAEGTAITFSAAGSSDPNGDALTYRWDFTADGTWDTVWSSSPTASFTFPDDFSGFARVEVSDGGFNATDDAPVRVRNVAPTVDAGPDKVLDEGSTLSLSATFRDPGFDSPAMGTAEDFTATFDWGYGPAEPGTVAEVPGGVGVPTTGTASGSRPYGDDGVFTVTATVCDDDGGCGSDTLTVTVRNLAPAIDSTVIPSGDERDTITFRARVLDAGSDDLVVTWWGPCTGWSPPTAYPNDPATYPDPDPSPQVHPRDVTDEDDVSCGDNAAFSWNLRVTDDDGGVTTMSGTFSIANLPPTLTVTPPASVSVDEGTLVTLTVTAGDPGSDDLAFSWAWQYGPTDVHVAYNDGVGPDPAESPNGTYPFSASNASSFTYGDDGTYTVRLIVADDDGGSVEYTTTVQVSNVAPTVDAGADAATDEGAVIAFSFPFSDPGFDQPAAGTVEDFVASADWGDGTASTLSVLEVPGGPGAPTTGTADGWHIYADNGVYTVTVTVCDDDGGCGSDSLAVTVANVPPTVDAGADLAVDEAAGLAVVFSFTDPGFDFPPADTVEDFTATVDWGYGPAEFPAVDEVPGSPGVPTYGTISVTHVYGDNGAFVVTVTVCDDDGGCGSDTMTVTVGNVDPTILDVQAYVLANLTLRVAGEKWHDVRMDLEWNGDVTGTARVVRYPGSPDRQSASIEGGRLQLLGSFSITLYYTPADDPVNGQPNGANPAWVIIQPPGEEEIRLHHTFNVQHPTTWTWTLDDFRPYLLGHRITFEASAADVGSDDLTFAWDFGDGASAVTTHYNDGVGPDPFPSPEVNPIAATDVATHAFGLAGTYAVTLTVTDDDGGAASTTVSMSVG